MKAKLHKNAITTSKINKTNFTFIPIRSESFMTMAHIPNNSEKIKFGVKLKNTPSKKSEYGICATIAHTVSLKTYFLMLAV